MMYFEMTSGQGRGKELPKKFDFYVYKKIYTLLQHKPTINPLHIRDLLSPNDGNFRAPLGGLEGHQSAKDSRGSLNAYASTMAFDVAANSFFEDDYMPKEIDGSSTSR